MSLAIVRPSTMKNLRLSASWWTLPMKGILRYFSPDSEQNQKAHYCQGSIERISHLENSLWTPPRTQQASLVEHHPPGREASECVFHQWSCSDRRLKRSQAFERSFYQYADWDAILRISISLEWGPIRLQKWYLVVGLCPLWDGNVEASLQSRFTRKIV